MSPTRSLLYLVAYRWQPEMTDRIREVYPRHRVHIDELGGEGRARLIGTIVPSAPAAGARGGGAEPVAEPTGAVAVFTDLLAAEEFLTGDPLVLAGLIDADPIQTWSVIDYGPPGGTGVAA